MTTTTPHHRSRQLKALPPNLPGADLVEAGMASLKRGERTTEALLVALGSPRLRALGIDVPQSADDIATPNLALYEVVCDNGGDHFYYNALLRRLSSFADAAEWRMRETSLGSGARRSLR